MDQNVKNTLSIVVKQDIIKTQNKYYIQRILCNSPLIRKSVRPRYSLYMLHNQTLLTKPGSKVKNWNLLYDLVAAARYVKVPAWDQCMRNHYTELNAVHL